ncbi:MAG: EAL domain-containing protein [Rhodoferax sp.]|nr:EAL domain-containing protein [Rhodoferax sp.]
MNTLQILGLIALPILIWLYWLERRRHRRTTERMGRALQDMSGRLTVDAHTGLLTLAGFEARLAEEVQRVGRTDGSLSILSLSLDNFTLITNGFDSIGAAQIVQSVATRLSEAAGPEARVATLSGSDYLVITSGGGRIGSLLAERIQKAFAQPVPAGASGRSAPVSCSIGVAVYPQHGNQAEIASLAGLALRKAQEAGPGHWRLYEPAMGQQARDEAVLVQDLRQAVAEGQLELYFQPKIDARSLQVTAAESLVRWHHPTRGFVSPGVFIPLAERYGLIGDIGDWVIQAACEAAAQWAEIGLRMRVAVNISGHQMRQTDLVEKIVATLRLHQLEPGRFTCEITETVAMEDTAATRLTFEKMGRAGLHVSIDDFGTGYSSLASLRQLPAAELKIDRAFVTELETSEKARNIARSVIELARSLKLRVVAEGVETPGQRDILAGLGYNDLQGFLFCMPVNAAEIQRMATGGGGPAGRVGFRDSLYATDFQGELAGRATEPGALRG